EESPASAWAQSKSQSCYEGYLQKCGVDGEQPGGSLPRFLPGLTHQRHEAGDGSPHLGTKDCGDHFNRLEERSAFRRETTETTSSLSVSDQESVPPLGIILGGGQSGSSGDARIEGEYQQVW